MSDDLDPIAAEPVGFRWPTPPLASYPTARAQIDHEPCEIVGLNGRVMQGRLNLFVPEDQVAHIQVPPARTTMPLRFGQFRSLSLKRPLLPLNEPLEEAGEHAQALSERPATDYVIELQGGGELRGRTIGWIESSFGLFLFPPEDEAGGVTRLFVPNEAIAA